MTRKEESTVAKRALISAGFNANNVRVKHGTGTDIGWLKVDAYIGHVSECSCYSRGDGMRAKDSKCWELWQNSFDRILQVVIEATGRDRYEAEQIGISLGFIE